MSVIIEKTEVWFILANSLESSCVDGRAVRGFFGDQYKSRPEFHGHLDGKLIYKHPLIQYKIFGGIPLVIGLKEGAYLLKALPTLDNMEIYRKQYRVIKQNTVNDVPTFGLTDEIVHYSFESPWIGLNEENHIKYHATKSPSDANSLLDRILIGNLLSMSKSLGYSADERIHLTSNLRVQESIEVKQGVKLLGFTGEFETNFIIPELWGIGKFSSRGYGTVRRLDGGTHEK